MRFIFFIGLLAQLALLAGCSSLEKSSTQVGGSEVSETKKVSLTPKQMYQLMLGELLVQKGDFNNAFDLIFPVAQETQDLELVERSFHLSTNTFNPQNIEKSANLWRQVEPDSALAWRVAYLMALRNGEVEEALADWENYRAKSNLHLEDDLKTSASQVAQSIDATIALGFFEKVYEKYPKEWAAGYAYAYIAEQFSRPDLAVSILEETAAKHSMPGEAYFLLANSYIASNQAARGLANLVSFLQENPEDWSIQERYARLEVMAGRYQEAKGRYELILKHNPQASTSKLSLALLYLELGELDPAKKLLEQVVNAEGYQDVSQYYLGVIAHQKGDLKLAEHHLKLVANPNYTLDAQILLAQIKYETLGLREALEVLDQVELASDESKIKVWRAKGILYGQVADYAKSSVYYSQILSLDNSPEFYYAYAMSLYFAKDYQSYETTLLEAVEIYPAEADLLNALGYFYADENFKLAQAEVLLDKALELDPKSFHILDSRAWLAYRMQDFVLAEKLIEESWSLLHNHETLIHLIKIKWALGKTAEAEQIWIQEHRNYPANKEVQNLLNKLRNN